MLAEQIHFARSLDDASGPPAPFSTPGSNRQLFLLAFRRSPGVSKSTHADDRQGGGENGPNARSGWPAKANAQLRESSALCSAAGVRGPEPVGCEELRSGAGATTTTS